VALNDKYVVYRADSVRSTLIPCSTTSFVFPFPICERKNYNAGNYNIAWTWKFVYYFKGRTQIDGVSEQELRGMKKQGMEKFAE
jgi:hypothetical protein